MQEKEDLAPAAQARALLQAARHAALSWLAPDGAPGISRIALGLDDAGGLVSLISDLTQHAPALRIHPACALMVGEVGARGDPLTHPRLMIRARAGFVAPEDPARPALRALWLKDHPKSKLYVDFADFAFVRFNVTSALLNAGFGRAPPLGAAARLP
jgi:putative heme iron utilization protein